MPATGIPPLPSRVVSVELCIASNSSVFGSVAPTLSILRHRASSLPIRHNQATAPTIVFVCWPHFFPRRRKRLLVFVVMPLSRLRLSMKRIGKIFSPT